MRKTRSPTVREILVNQEEIGAFPLERALLTPRQTAAALKISRRTLLYWTPTGNPKNGSRRRGPKIPFVMLGGRKRFVVADVLRFLEERKIQRTPTEDDQTAA